MELEQVIALAQDYADMDADTRADLEALVGGETREGLFNPDTFPRIRAFLKQAKDVADAPLFEFDYPPPFMADALRVERALDQVESKLAPATDGDDDPCTDCYADHGWRSCPDSCHA